MEKRVLIAFLLSIAVLVVYSMIFPQPKKVVQEETAQKTVAEEPAIEATKAGEETKAEIPVKPMPEVARPAAAPEKLIRVETDLYSAVFSTRGGVIKSWKLKKYTDAEGGPIEMKYFEGGVSPLLVVPEGMDADAAQSLEYRPDRDKIDIGAGREGGELTLTYNDATGRSIIKRLSFGNDTYSVGLELETAGIKECRILMGESFGSLTEKAKKGYGYTGPLVYIDGETKNRGAMVWLHGILNKSEEEARKVKTYEGASGWTAITDQYFVAGIIPEGKIKVETDKGESDWGFVGIDADTSKGPLKTKIYVGPKEYDRLREVGGDFEQAVDFGWFSFIAKPLFVALKFFHGLVGNFGWSIIIITVIIKLLFAPLTHKQQKSMRRMQQLQPKIVELKEKYKGDPQKMNMEMMELYKREKVNPLGGCLPMLIQIPVFIALYKVLYNAIELRHAPFMWWLQDLSAKDPYYILPVLMGISMFAMQKMTPTTMDPKQAKIMMIMPVVLTFMFINLPSGLVLYFTLSNLLSMVQQLYINRTMEG